MGRRIAFWFLLLINLSGSLCADDSDESILLKRKEIKKGKGEFYPNDDADTKNAQKHEFLYLEPEDGEEGVSISTTIQKDQDLQIYESEIPFFCSIPIDYYEPNPLTRWSVVYNSPNYSHPVFSTDANSSSLSDNHRNMCSDPENIEINHNILEEISITNGSNAVYYAHVWKSYAFKFMETPGPIIKCTVHQKTINQDIIDEDPYNSKPRFVLLDEPTCNFILLDMTFQTAGDWEFITYYNDTTNSSNTIRTQRYDIRLIAISSYARFQIIEAMIGEYKILSNNEKKNENAVCKYFNDNSEELPADYIFAEPYGKCGIRLYYFFQKTIIIRVISGYTATDKYYGIVERDRIAKHYKHWKTGSSGSFKLNAFGNIACELIKPDGTNITLVSPQCNYTINNVSSEDQGTWTARYYFFGNTSVDEYYIINVWEPQSVWITVDKTENSINLACRAVENYENCTFEKFVGTVVDYRYSVPIHQKYPTEEPLSECLLKISSPTEKHYGTWRCSMGYKGFNVSRNFTLEEDIKEIGQSEAFEIDGLSYVEIGDKFQINCPCNSSLKYCFIKSPDQVTFSVLENKTFFDYSEINDTQITFNDCGITIDYANNGHDGHWMREFSFNENTVFQTNFMLKTVYIKSTVFVAHNANQTAYLTCSSFSNDLHLETSCSWDRPNGHGILEFDSANYTSERNNCELQIRALSPEDLGNWTCYAKIKEGFNKTFSSTVELKFKPKFLGNTSEELSTYEAEEDMEEFYLNDDVNTRNAQKPEFLYVEPEDEEEGDLFSFILPKFKDEQENKTEIPSFCSFPIDYSDPNHLTKWSYEYNSPNHSHPVLSTDANSSSLSNNHHKMCSVPEKIKVHLETLEEISITNDSNAVYYAYVPGNHVFKFMEPPGPIIKCTVHQKTINQDIIEQDLYDSTSKFVILNEPTCNFYLLNMTSHSAGDWEFTTYYNDTTNSSNTIRMQKYNIRLLAIQGFPRTVNVKEIKARRGEYKIVSVDERDTQNATCKYLDRISGDELTGNKKLAKPYGKCGIRFVFDFEMRIDIRIIFGYTVIEKNYNILESDQNIPIKKHYKHWKTDSVGRFELNAYENNACQLVKPDGTNITLESPQCNYTIHNVSSEDQGTWTARYHLNDNTSVDEYYIINVWEPQSVWITVDKARSSINLACRAVENYKNCTFEKYDGTSVAYRYSVPIRQKYPTEEPLSECLLQISSPTEKHYGTWRCSMGYEGFNVTRNFTLEKDIKEIGQSETMEIDGISKVIMGDKFQIKCPCNDSLKYCFIKSPDQVIYSILENKTFFDSSKTINNEITIDNCSITINYANNTHDGRWMREFSFNENTVVQTNFVLEIVRLKAIYQPTMQEKPAYLNCALFSGHLYTESTCLWSRPDGHNISAIDSEHYTNTHNMCKLQIHALSSEDRGNWTCYAKMKEGFKKTFSSTVELKFEPEIFMNASKELSTNTSLIA